jgi:hypothetical protein
MCTSDEQPAVRSADFIIGVKLLRNWLRVSLIFLGSLNYYFLCYLELIKLCEIWGFHGGDCYKFYLLWCRLKLWNPVEAYWRFGEKYHLHTQERRDDQTSSNRSLFLLFYLVFRHELEAARSSETLTNLYQDTGCNIPENSTLLKMTFF